MPKHKTIPATDHIAPNKAHLTIAGALQHIADPNGERSAVLFEHGTLQVKVYAPRGTDPQTPHSRDEIYVVMQGNGVFYNGDDRRNFGPGDFLFAPAGSIHRFEDFSDDFAVWVMYFGPEGGEV